MLWSELKAAKDAEVLELLDFTKLASSIQRLSDRFRVGMGKVELRSSSLEFKKLFKLKDKLLQLSILADSPLTIIKNDKAKGHTYRLDEVCPHRVSLRWKALMLEVGFKPNWPMQQTQINPLDDWERLL